jgi:type I restriction enzyme S subunit
MKSNGTKRLGDFFGNRREVGKVTVPTMSVTLTDGLVPREMLERKTETSLVADQHLFVKRGDIAYNMMRMWQGASGAANQDCNVSPAYVVLSPLIGIDSTFASYLFKTPRMLYLFWAYSYGLADDRLRLYFREFSRIPVSLPNLRTQKQLGDALLSLDELIKCGASLLSWKRERRRVVVDDLLEGHRRIPQFRDSGWRSAPLRDFAEVNPTRHSYEPDGAVVPFVSMSNVRDGGGLAEVQTRPRPEVGGGFTSFKNGDVLVAKITPCFENQKRALIRNLPESLYLGSTEFLVLRAKDLDSAYLYYSTLTSRFHRYGVTHMVGSAGQKRVPASSMRRYPFHIPSRQEQSAIVRILSTIDEEIDLLARYSVALNNLKAEILSDARFFCPGTRRVK